MRKARGRVICGSTIGLIVMATGARAADEPPAPAADEKLQEVVVTGTSIRGAAPVGSNLITVGREDIEASGAQTLQQVLRSVPAVTGFGNSGQADVVPGPLRHAAMSRTGLASLTSSGLPHHAILLAHFNGDPVSAGRGSREIRGCAPRAAYRSCRGCDRGPETAPAAAPRPRRN